MLPQCGGRSFSEQLLVVIAKYPWGPESPARSNLANQVFSAGLSDKFLARAVESYIAQESNRVDGQNFLEGIMECAAAYVQLIAYFKDIWRVSFSRKNVLPCFLDYVSVNKLTRMARCYFFQ